jgi:hypothetical protein
VFTTPKPFRGHIEVIQRNAIRSWMLLRPACEIILFGDDEGTREIARDFGVRHVADVACNQYGTPLVNDMFEKAQRLAMHDMLCYVNADIIFMSDFMAAAEQVANLKRRFLMVGQRWDVDLKEAWDFHAPSWEASLRGYVREQGLLHPKSGIDYSVFRQGLLDPIPPFAVGRPTWDNWLVYRARKRLAAVVDATNVVMAVHQNHDYGDFGSKEAVWNGPEAQQNRELLAGRYFALGDATHLLMPDGLRFAWSLDKMPWHLRQIAILFLPLPVQSAIRSVLKVTRKHLR